MKINEAIKDLEDEIEKCYGQCEGLCSEIENNKCMCRDAVILDEFVNMSLNIIQLKENIEKSKWKSVKNELPKDERKVLVKLAHTYADDGYIEYGIAKYLKFEEGSYWCEDSCGYLEWDRYSDGRSGCSLYKVIEWKEI